MGGTDKGESVLLGWISLDNDDEEDQDAWDSRLADTPTILAPEVPGQGGAPAEAHYLARQEFHDEGGWVGRDTPVSSLLVLCPRSL